MGLQLQTIEPLLQSHDGHLYQVADASASNLHVVGFRLQARTMTLRTCGLTPVAGQHHAVLYLVLILLHHLEELVDTRLFLLALIRGQSVPQPVFLPLRQVHVGFEDGEIVVSGIPAEPVFPFSHLLSVPAHHAAVIDAQRRVGDHQLLVNTHNLAKALTLRTGSCWRVKREHLV